MEEEVIGHDLGFLVHMIDIIRSKKRERSLLFGDVLYSIVIQGLPKYVMILLQALTGGLEVRIVIIRVSFVASTHGTMMEDPWC